MYYEKPDTTKNTPVASISIIALSILHIGVWFVIRNLLEIDEIGYPSTILYPFIYFTAALLIIGIIVGLRNKSLGYIDMILVFIILFVTYIKFI